MNEGDSRNGMLAVRGLFSNEKGVFLGGERAGVEEKDLVFVIVI